MRQRNSQLKITIKQITYIFARLPVKGCIGNYWYLKIIVSIKTSLVTSSGELLTAYTLCETWRSTQNNATRLFFFLHYCLTNSMTIFAQLFTCLLFDAYVGIHQVRILVFDTNYQTCQVLLFHLLLRFLSDIPSVHSHNHWYTFSRYCIRQIPIFFSTNQMSNVEVHVQHATQSQLDHSWPRRTMTPSSLFNLIAT